VGGRSLTDRGQPRRNLKYDDHPMMDDDRDVGDRQFDPVRDAAERRYVAALIALDTAAEPSTTIARTAAAAAADVMRLNQAWQHAGSEKPGLAARVIAELGRLLPWRRRRLLGAMVAAINRNTETTRALIDANQQFQSHVIWYAQTVAGLAHEPASSNPEGLAALRQAIDAIATHWLKHADSNAAREERSEARMAALTKAYDDLRELTNLAQQGTLSLKRVVERRMADGVSAAAGAPAPVSTSAAAPETDAFKYVVFEDRFRGSRDEIRQRLTPYVSLFAGATSVMDLGCGRGELLDLLREQGVTARGVDQNEAMVEACRARGLTADQGDALAALESQPDNSLGGVIAIQVVEHLEPGYLMRLIETAHHKLAPGAPLVLETINAACWAAFFDSYIRDFTHAHPIHPDTLQYLTKASGFATADIKFLAPIADHEKLPTVRLPAMPAGADPTVVELVEAVNAHADRLNSQLFTYRDFAVIAYK